MSDRPVSFWHRLLQLIAPQACAICGCRLAIDEQLLCARCNMHLPRTTYARQADDNEMVRRFWGHGPVERAAALFHYEAGSEVSRVIFRMKYHNHPEAGEILGTWVAREVARYDFFEGMDAIVPVPLSKRRERQHRKAQGRADAEQQQFQTFFQNKDLSFKNAAARFIFFIISFFRMAIKISEKDF